MQITSLTGLLDELLREAGSGPLVLGYLDPGTGSIVFQWIIAGLVGTAFVIKISWRHLLGLFRKGPADNEESDG